VSDNQVIGIDIDAEIVDQISFCPLCGWAFDRKQTMCYQNSNPVQNRIVWTVQIQNFQVFRIKTVTIDKAVTQRGYSPFFGELFT
ncbi:Flagellin N-methylase, partial [Dysosmobacter welbionis]